LKETGVTAILLSSVLQSPQVDYGYDITDFKEVDEIFGDSEDLDALFEEAHNLGIKVIMDFVSSFKLQSVTKF
jgi:alpha-glucosidase